ncbi:hypothetical protein EVAR_5627_1 [Eumeta japonica]|uniref:Uncharacterized protein n=1 Tax=Eumeta variegata TaxID=151549 RepID=A0A4C1T805_EUMVA|nr:hypothetical protein EVAR_5627_1 [Eumeta japonica]
MYSSLHPRQKIDLHSCAIAKHIRHPEVGLQSLLCQEKKKTIITASRIDPRPRAPAHCAGRICNYNRRCANFAGVYNSAGGEMEAPAGGKGTAGDGINSNYPPTYRKFSRRRGASFVPRRAVHYGAASRNRLTDSRSASR